ncbi:hypothetical protein PFISCL1PPCAC_4643 [Pristionchus fissidentatus]|uniref:Uncharacterized protein n=1 Tax=Pristionchus fissidentatus TaxID=1538716 RepID=A0AAV5V1Z1_9BILA|nr:hypothetical protein PFISCL1PPCAC_4643 [Pristionchus fissidentatus]
MVCHLACLFREKNTQADKAVALLYPSVNQAFGFFEKTTTTPAPTWTDNLKTGFFAGLASWLLVLFAFVVLLLTVACIHKLVRDMERTSRRRVIYTPSPGWPFSKPSASVACPA